MKKFLPVLLLVSVVVLSGCISTPGQNGVNKTTNNACSDLTKSECESNTECKLHPDAICGVAGDCHKIYECKPVGQADCSSFNPLDDSCESFGEMLPPGYYVSSVTGKCELNQGNACNQMPFETLADCQSSCEEPDSATLCDSIECSGGQACFEGGCIPTDSKKINLKVEGYKESCSDEPRLFVEKNGKRVEVKNYLWDKAPIYVNGEYKEYPTLCDLLVCDNISESIEVVLMSYEKIGSKNSIPEYTTVPITDPVTVELNYYKTEEDCNKKINAQKFSMVYDPQTNEDYCSDFDPDECPSGCVLGSSCPVCEDISCRAEGYNKDW